MPERVEREEERPDRNTNDIDNHPTNHLESTIENEDNGLKTVDSSQHDQGSCWNRSVSCSDQDYQIDKVGNGDRTVRVRERRVEVVSELEGDREGTSRE